MTDKYLKAKSLFLIIVFLSCNSQRPDSEIYLINEGFTGIQYIIFNEKDGEPKEFDERGRRIYRLNNSGILRTQFEPNPGGFSQPMKKFYYVDKDGTKTKRFPWISLFATHHESFLKDTITFNNDSIVAFSYNFTRCEEACKSADCTCMGFIIDTLKNRYNRYPSISELLKLSK